MRLRFVLTPTVAVLGLGILAEVGCTRPAPGPRYHPRTREITVTTVPLLVREARSLYPFLESAFGKGGVLEGKEVYAFSPSTITVVEGDTVHFTIVNPEDDVHSFVLPDLAVPLPGNHEAEATYVAKRSGIYPFRCAVESHLPMMAGQLVVLSPGAVVPSDSTQEVAGR